MPRRAARGRGGTLVSKAHGRARSFLAMQEGVGNHSSCETALQQKHGPPMWPSRLIIAHVTGL